MSLCLDTSELQELTGKVRADAQSRVLNALGIDHRKRPDGSIVVLRSALDSSNRSKAPKGPNFEAAKHVA